MNNGRQMLASAQEIIIQTGKRLGLKKDIIQRLLEPEISAEFNLFIKNKNKLKIYKAYRIQHNSLLGPYKGGIRFHCDVSREEIQALAILMTIKCALTGLPYGGGKGGVVVDPKQLTEKELENLARAYSRAISPLIGPYIDIPAPDVNTNAKIIGWMVDEYVKNVKCQMSNVKSRAAFTGKPVEMGGTLGRREATGRGGVIILKTLLSKLKIPQLTVAVQGFGNVGYYFAKIAAENGFKIKAVSDSKGGIVSNDLLTLDIPLVMTCKQKKGNLAGCYCAGGVCDMHNGKIITNEQLLELPVDILVPAALENVINNKNMDKIKAKIIIEMANGPISEAAYEYLTKKGIIIVPDVLANSGGVIVSYLEWLQNIKNETWTEQKVNQELEKIITQAFTAIWQRSSAEKIPLKQAAFETAIKRICGKI